MSIYTYDEALQNSLGYFNQDSLAARVFLDKYALRNNNQELLEKNPDEMHRRIAKEFARIENKKFKNPLKEEEIYNLLKGFKKIVPQGSPMYGIGNDYQIISLSNCYVVPSPEDSYGGIARADERLVQISKRRGGVGLDISNLRPSGAITHNAARTSTGIIPFMERYSNSIREVGQSGRRGALMITISCHHPEILDFAKVKRDLTKVTGANISVRLTNEFLNAVVNKEKYEMRWPVDAREKGREPEVSKMVDANEVWDLIIENAHFMAEPGLLFWDRIISESPADCYKEYGFETISTNPCSEIPLSAFDSCRLLLLNLLGYVVNPWAKDAYFDFESFYKDSQVAQRLMDDLIDLEIEKIDKIINKITADPEDYDVKYIELDMWEKIREVCYNGRRTGTGITALGDALAACNIKYGSKESLDFVDKVYKTLKLGCYRSSVDMAKELGAFPVFNASLEADNPFINRIKEEDAELFADMQKYGRRNICLLTTAPAGSVSIETQTTSGIEPVFDVFYLRKKKINPNDQNSRVDSVDQNGDSWQHFFVLHPRFEEWARIHNHTIPNLETESPEIVKKVLDELYAMSPWFEAKASELDWPVRVELQSIANRHVDHAISSTLNLPNEVTVDQVKEIYIAAWQKGCKGITVYRDGCRTGVLSSTDSKPKKTDAVIKTDAPKRTKELDADVHHIKVTSKGSSEEYFVIVGLLNDEPYEIFAGKNGMIPKSVKKAKVKKIKRGHYQATLDNGQVVENIAEHISDEQESLTRIASCALRHGADISYLVHQLEKAKGDMMSFSKAMARALKKHIKDGTKITGEECPQCKGNNLIRQDGCCICKDCGYSKCS